MSLPERKIKILHVIDLSKTGGVEVMFMDFLSKILALEPNLEHEVFALRVNLERKNILSELGVKAYFPKNNKYNLFRRLKIIKLMALKKYDIVHGQNFSGNFWAAVGKFFQFRTVKLISHEHGGSWWAEGLLKIASKFWAFNSRLIICNSNAAAKIIKAKIYKKAKLKVIYNGIRRPNLKISIAKTKNNFNILFVGRLEEVKGLRELASALKILHERDVQFICNILGEGELRAWLSRYIEDNGLHDKVTLHGIVNSVDQFMANSDVLVLPSIREPLGNVIIEAAHQNLPVIASDVDGISEIIKNYDTGVLLKPRFIRSLHKLPKQVVNAYGELAIPMAIDPNELAYELTRLKKDPVERKAYGLRSNQLLKDFTIERYSQAISEIYLNL